MKGFTVSNKKVTRKLFLILFLILPIMLSAGPAAGQTNPPPLHDFSVGKNKDAAASHEEDDGLALFIEAGSGNEIKKDGSKVQSAPPLPPGADHAMQNGSAESGPNVTKTSQTESGEQIKNPFAPPPATEEHGSKSAPSAAAPPTTENSGQTQALSDSAAGTKNVKHNYAPQWAEAINKNPSSGNAADNKSDLSLFDPEGTNWKNLEVGQVDSTFKTFKRPDNHIEPDNKPAEVTPAIETVTKSPQTSAGPQENKQTEIATPGSKAIAITGQATEEKQKIINLFHDMSIPDTREMQHLQAPELQSNIIRQKIEQNAEADGIAPGQIVTDQKGTAIKSKKNITTDLPNMEEKRVQEKINHGEAANSDQTKNDSGGSAILKAGKLLSVEQQFGAAEILPPMGPHNVTSKAPAAEQAKGAPKKAQVDDQKNKAKSGVRKTEREKKNSSAHPVQNIKTQKKFSLAIIDETSNASLGQVYASVLRQMGYGVSSVQNNPVSGGGLSGQTVVFYPPGQKNQAHSLARHLPGKKMFFEAKDSSQIIIKLR